DLRMVAHVDLARDVERTHAARIHGAAAHSYRRRNRRLQARSRKGIGYAVDIENVVDLGKRVVPGEGVVARQGSGIANDREGRRRGSGDLRADVLVRSQRQRPDAEAYVPEIRERRGAEGEEPLRV